MTELAGSLRKVRGVGGKDRSGLWDWDLLAGMTLGIGVLHRGLLDGSKDVPRNAASADVLTRAFQQRRLDAWAADRWGMGIVSGSGVILAFILPSAFLLIPWLFLPRWAGGGRRLAAMVEHERARAPRPSQSFGTVIAPSAGMRAIRLGLFGFLAGLMAACGEASTTVSPARPKAADAVRRGPHLSGRGSTVTPPAQAVVAKGVAGDRPSVSPAGGAKDIRVFVVDAADRPVEGARVSHTGSAAVTDAEGRASLRAPKLDLGSPVRDPYGKTLTIAADGYEPQVLRCGWDDEGVARVRLVQRACRVAGRVVDTAGRPLGGVPVRLRPARGRDREVTTDPYGAFACKNVPFTETRVWVSGQGWISPSLPVVPPVDGLRLVAFQKATIRGGIDLPRGASLPKRLRVELDSRGWNWWDEALEDGFSFPCLPGDHTLLVNGRPWRTFTLAEGDVVDDVRIPLADVGPPREDARSKAPPASWVTVDLHELSSATTYLVAFFDDRPASALEHFSGGSEHRLPLPSNRLTGIGVYETGRGTWRQAAVARAWVVLRRPAMARPACGIETAGGPVRTGFVRLRWPGTSHVASTASNAGDRWTFDPVAPGRYDLVWQPSGNHSGVLLVRGVEVTDREPGQDLGTVPFPPPLRLRVRVEEGTGPVAGAVVGVRTVSDVLAVRTDAAGLAEFALQDPVDVRVEVRAPDGATAAATVAEADLDRTVVLRVGPRDGGSR